MAEVGNLGDIRATVQVEDEEGEEKDGFWSWLKDEGRSGIRSFYGIEQTRHHHDISVDIAIHASQTAHVMSNLAPKALSVQGWAQGATASTLKWSFGKVTAAAGLSKPIPIDFPSDALNKAIGAVNRDLGLTVKQIETRESIYYSSTGDEAGIFDGFQAIDRDRDGRREVCDAPGTGDFLLGYDADADQSIDPATEGLSRDFLGLSFASAHDALASLDGNGDGMLDGDDPEFGNLYLYGVPASGASPDTHTLGDLGITEIDLDNPTTEAIRKLGRLGSEINLSFPTPGAAGILVQARVGQSQGEIDSIGYATTAGETLEGTHGNDLLYAAATGVTLRGLGGDDVLVTLSGDTRILAGSGEDIVFFLTDTPVSFDAGLAGAEAVVGGTAGDVLRSGVAGGTLDGDLGADRLIGGNGPDAFRGGPGNDFLNGNGGRDLAIYEGSVNGFNLRSTSDGWRITDTVTSDGNEGTDTLRGIEVLSFDDAAVVLSRSEATVVQRPADRAPLALDDSLLSLGTRLVFRASDLTGNDLAEGSGPLDIVSVAASSGRLRELSGDRYRLIAPDRGDQTIELTYRIEDGAGRRALGHAQVHFRPQPRDEFGDLSWYMARDNVRAVWPDYDGSGVHVAVNEPGLFPATHPALSHAFDGSRPGAGSSAHGVAVTSVMTAGHDDGGLIGVSPGITFSRWTLNEDFASTGPEFFTGWDAAGAPEADIVNNSWTYPTFSRGSFFSDYRLQRDGLERFAEDGREGLGGIAVFASSNIEAGSSERLDYHYLSSTRFGIPVAHVDDLGRGGRAAPGAAMFLSATGTDMPVADLIGAAGYADETAPLGADHAILSGTSLATPLVSGVVALMLDANPRLGYRDVQEILALTAQKTDTTDSSWLTNGATGANGGGLHWSEVYGFGRVDARAAVRLAETWHSRGSAANLETRSLPDEGRIVYIGPDSIGSERRVFDPASHPDGGDLLVEHVEVTLHGILWRQFDGTVYDTYSLTRDNRYWLESPAGTIVDLTTRPPIDQTEGIVPDWVFTATGFRGETASGIWRLWMQNYDTGEYAASVDIDWSLTLHGRARPEDDRYVYTDEIFDFGPVRDGTRFRIADTGGHDELNAAALTAPVIFDLSRQTQSFVGDREIRLTPGTRIEDAIGGDADDILVGSGAANRIAGARGDDLIHGRGGRDVLLGGPGRDVLAGGAGADRLDGQAGEDHLFGQGGRDRLSAGAGDDLANGGAGNDRLWGRGGDDTLIGQGGADVLEDGEGRDHMSGGAGADVFRLVPDGARDWIDDFVPGVDRIDLPVPRFRAIEVEEIGGGRLLLTYRNESLVLDNGLGRGLDAGVIEPGDFLF